MSTQTRCKRHPGTDHICIDVSRDDTVIVAALLEQSLIAHFHYDTSKEIDAIKSFISAMNAALAISE